MNYRQAKKERKKRRLIGMPAPLSVRSAWKALRKDKKFWISWGDKNKFYSAVRSRSGNYVINMW